MDSQDRLDAKTLRYISENAEAEHTLLTPLRWLIGISKFMIYAALLLGWFAFTLVGWVFDVGEYSLENRREAVCDARAYAHVCDINEFNSTHPHGDYEWNVGNEVVANGVINAPDAHPVSDPDLPSYVPGQTDPELLNPAPKPWFNLGDGEFILRGNDVFRRKSAQMDDALSYGDEASRALRFSIADLKHLDTNQVHLTGAPVIVVRDGVIPADALGAKQIWVTWGMCLKQECAADGSDLNYYLTWGDAMYTRPPLGPHQQHAVDALTKMGTLPFWLEEFHDNGIQNDELIQKKLREFEHARAMTAKDLERELLHRR